MKFYSVCSDLIPLATAAMPSDVFAFVVIGTALFSGLSVLGMVFDSELPSSTQGARLLIGLLSLAWIGFFTLASFQGGTFVGLVNLAPYFLIKSLRK